MCSTGEGQMAAVMEARPGATEKLVKDGKVSIYQPDQEGLFFACLPSFSSHAEHRQHLKERLVGACRAFAQQGFDYGFAGHLTVRDPENPGLYWTNPMAIHFSQVKVSNLICADPEGRWVEGNHAINRAGFVLHAAVHEMHQDIVAMCHAHTIYGTAFAALGKKLEPVTQDAAAFFEDHGVATPSPGAKAAIHKNLGLRTASRHSIESAAFWFIALERCCQQQLMIDATGITPKLVSPERSRYSREHVGS